MTLVSEVLYTIGQVAKRLSVTPQAIYKAEAEGRIRTARREPAFGGRLYDEADIEELLRYFARPR